MVKDLRPSKEVPSYETKTTDEPRPSDSMIFISKEDSMPVFVEKPNRTGKLEKTSLHIKMK